MSHVGLIGSPGAFKANLLNLKQSLQEVVTPLTESAPGLPWQRTNQTDEYKAPQPDFENVLREALMPDDPESVPASTPAPKPTPEPVKPQTPRHNESLPPQLTQNSFDFEQRVVQQQSASGMFFNYNVKSAGGHYRTELARNAYANALGRMG
ncbi:MAG: hypothetical protein HQL99_05895 [Magnetococcales bacterium]|nr:hypothetical protein [Magnetococcales bacterium]